MSFPWEIDAQPSRPRGRKSRQRARNAKKLEAAKQAKRRAKQHPEPPSDELTERQIAKLLREQEMLLAKRIPLPRSSNAKSTRDERLARKVAIAGDDPALKKAYRSKVKKTKKRIRPRGEKKAPPLMREIIRPFPQGRRLFLERIPTDKAPLTAKEYAQYLRSPHWQRFGHDYRTDDSTLHQCYVCGSAEYELHHWTYARIGREEFTDVVPLCRTHHQAAHKAMKAGVPLARAHSWVKSRIKSGQPL